MKTPGATPLSGYNTGVLHRGTTYHIQTEDSGVKHPHVITHLFDAGRILAKQKTSYAEFVSAPNYRDIVKEVIRAQHKAMFTALRSGRYDGIARVTPGTTPPAPREEPALDVSVIASALSGKPSRPSVAMPAVQPPAAGAVPEGRQSRPSSAAALFGPELDPNSLDDVILSHLAVYLPPLSE